MTPRMHPRRRWLQHLAATTLIGGLGPAAWGVHAATETVPRLRRGVNLAHWFEYERTQGLTPEELRGLQAHGLDHVRLPVDPIACGWRPEAPDQTRFVQALERAVGQIVEAGLIAVVDLHLTPEQKQTIENDLSYEPLLVGLWSRMAAALAGQPVRAVLFELFNEPQYYGAKGWRWPGLQRRLLAAVRQHAPKHGVLLSPARGGSIEALLAMAPEPDPLAAYTFHFYEPFVFTHQAVSWLDERYTAAGTRAGVLYPGALNRQRPPRVLKTSPKAAQEWADYLAQDWGPQAVRREIDRVGQWAKARGVRVSCTEFGAIRAQVDPASRYRWLADVRSACEANGIGWTVWDYTHIFGITAQSTQTGQAGRRHIEPLAVTALGLSPRLN